MSHEMPRILIVDDEFDIRQMALLALQYEGWIAREAANGREALDLVREFKPDLLFVDMMMPGMTGLEFCHRLIEEIGLTDVPVVLISAMNERAKLLKDFMDLPLRHREFLHKPFSTDRLVESARRMLGLAKQPLPAAPPPPQSHASAPAGRPAAQPAAAAPLPSSIGGGSGYRVLIVDDDPDILTVLETMLSTQHTVSTALNGMEGLAVLDWFAPDLVILDVNMPVMNGLETAEAIRRHPMLSGVPIFFLTGETNRDLPRKAFDVGGNLYLRKPIAPEQMLKTIEVFIRETGTEPGGNLKLLVESRARGPLSHHPPITESKGDDLVPAVVRLLTVDFNIENQQTLRDLLKEATDQPIETLWSEDPRAALGNLARWQPDAILFNPRNAGMDGVAFGQTLLLQKDATLPQVAFLGTRFYDVDLAYSERHFGRRVIDLSAPRDMVLRRLSELLRDASAKAVTKEFSMDEISAEQRETLRARLAADARQARQQEAIRRRYQNIQEFIDSHLR